MDRDRSGGIYGGRMNWREARDPGAWVELDRTEGDGAWNRVYEDLEFVPSMQPDAWPGFAEPDQSSTWDIVPLFTEHRISSGLVTVAEGLRRALNESMGSDDFVLALDWQHPGYQFRPRLASAPTDWESWLVPALPDGDYYLFLATDFRFGWLSHPWEQTVCCFGDLLPRMQPVLDGLGLDVIRGIGSERSE